MKIKQTDYEMMKKKIKEALKKFDITIVEATNHFAQNPKINNPMMAAMWRTFHAAKINTKHLYEYCNDDHIETALKKIAQELI